MKRLIYIALVLTGCATAQKAEITQSDSTRVEIIKTVEYRDTIIYVSIPAESEKAILPPDDLSHLETTFAESDAYVRGGVLTHTLRNKHEAIQPIEIKIPQIQVQKKKAEVLYRDRTEIVERNFTTWESFFMTSGKIAISLLLLWLLVAAGKKWL